MLQLLIENMNLKKGMLPLLIGGLVFGPAAPAHANTLWCSDILARKASHFDLLKEQRQFRHSARFIGDQVTQENLRRSILDLSGRLPIDDKGCIGDRCADRNKDRYISYLQRRLNGLAVHNYLEEGTSSYSFDKKESKKGTVNNNPGAGPLDLATVEPGFANILFKTKRTKLMARFLREIGFNFDLLEYRKINLEMINALLVVAKNSSPHFGPLMKFNLNINHMTFTKSEFFKNHSLRLSLIEQLDALKTRILAGEAVKNEAIAKEKEKQKELKSKKALAAKRADIINVIAEIPGSTRPNEIIEVSAHYDSISDRHPGADDNGSGLSTMMEMIRIFKIYPPERTIRFVFTDLEERGMQGSQLHVERAIERKDVILGALIVDTIGYHPLRESGEKPVFVLELGTPGMRPSNAHFELASSFADVIAWQFARYERYVRMSVETFGAIPGTADHGSYFRTGLPGILVAAPYEGDFINPGYHKTSDVIEQYNWLYFLSIARGLTEAVAVASGAKISERDIRSMDPEVLAHYNVQYKDVSPSKDHKAVVQNKGGKSFGGGGMMGGGSGARKRSSSSSSGDYFYEM